MQFQGTSALRVNKIWKLTFIEYRPNIIMNNIILFVTFFILSSITVLLVNWSGGELVQIDFQGLKYSSFVFRENRDSPMTMNILMNILIPNVCMTVLYLVLAMAGIKYLKLFAIEYVISFYIFRAILICLILKRKELYSIKYEITIALIGIIISIALYKLYLSKESELFITYSELRTELWLAILLIVYKFICLILDNHVNQSSVLPDSQIKKYIIHRFEYFYSKYLRKIDSKIDETNNYIYLTMFAIMIYEDFNRNELARKLETIKLGIIHHATVSVLQISSDKTISEDKAIDYFITCAVSKRDIYIEKGKEDYNNYLKENPDERMPEDLKSNFIPDYNLSNTNFASDFSYDYNTDSSYPDAICFIYEIIYQYIVSENSGNMRKIFHAANE